MASQHESVELRIEDSIAWLTMTRPDSLNALNPDMAEALFAAASTVAADPGARCLVIRGAGGHFMSGGDIRFFAQALARPDDFPVAIFDSVHGLVKLLRQMDTPVLASVEGACAGFGVSLVAACDLALAAEDAVFTLAYRHIGVSPDGGSTWTLPRSIGHKRASELVLLGERFAADRAADLGLVNRCLPAAELAAQTRAWALALASGPRQALARGKALLRESANRDLDTQLAAEQACFIECAGEPDFAEGVGAYLDKRAPDFAA